MLLSLNNLFFIDWFSFDCALNNIFLLFLSLRQLHINPINIIQIILILGYQLFELVLHIPSLDLIFASIVCFLNIIYKG